MDCSTVSCSEAVWGIVRAGPGAQQTGAGHKALQELDEAMLAAEDYDTAAGGDTPEPVLGAGDLLDDFVLTACQAAEPDAAVNGQVQREGSTQGQDAASAEVADAEEWDFDPVVGSDDEDTCSVSIAPGCVLLHFTAVACLHF